MVKVDKSIPRKILSMDLSLNLPACAVGTVQNGVYEVNDVYYVDSKKGTATHPQKLDRIARMLEQIVKEHPDIDFVVREKGFSRFAQTTQTLFKVVGVSDLMGKRLLDVDAIDEIPPTTIKAKIAGYSKADKQEVEEGVRTLLPEHQQQMTFYSDDVSDAVAVGLTYCIMKGWLD